jgi:hypothetical protein
MARYSINKPIKPPTPGTASVLAQEVARRDQQEQQRRNRQRPQGNRPPGGPGAPNPNLPTFNSDQKPQLGGRGGTQERKAGQEAARQTFDQGPQSVAAGSFLAERAPAAAAAAASADKFKSEQTKDKFKGSAGAIAEEIAKSEAGMLGETGGTVSPTSGADTVKQEKTREQLIEEAKAEAKKAAEQKAIANKEAGQPQMGGTPTPKTQDELIQEAIDKLLREQVDVAAEREAMVGEMKAGEARNIQSTRARAGLGGMGLTGAAGAMESQVRQESGREQALTTADFDRKARAEALDRLLKGIDVKRSEEVYKKAMELYGEEEKPGEGGGEGEDEGALKDTTPEQKNIVKRGAEQFKEFGEDVQKAIAENGLGAVPDIMGDAWEGYVKTIFGENAKPEDYMASPVPFPPFVVPIPIIGGAENNPFAQIGQAALEGAGNVARGVGKGISDAAGAVGQFLGSINPFK